MENIFNYESGFFDSFFEKIKKAITALNKNAEPKFNEFLFNSLIDYRLSGDSGIIFNLLSNSDTSIYYDLIFDNVRAYETSKEKIIICDEDYYKNIFDKIAIDKQLEENISFSSNGSSSNCSFYAMSKGWKHPKYG